MACKYVYLAVNRVPSFLCKLVTLYKVGTRRWSEMIYSLKCYLGVGRAVWVYAVNTSYRT
jgi:hypothetical protein